MIINVLELLEENVQLNPEKTALMDNDSQITYRELQIQAKKIGSYIVDKCKAKRKPVAVCIDRNIESIIAFLGVLYSGNFYVPLDTNMPKERVDLILGELNPVMVIASKNQQLQGHEVLPLEKLVKFSENDNILKKIMEEQVDSDPIYAIYTSGSTGKPKGVLVSQRSVIDLIEQFALAFEFPKETVIGNQAPFDFDVSVKDIYNSLYQHATLVVIPKQLFSMPVKLIEFINEKQINTIIWAVSAMRIVENFKTFSKIIPTLIKLIMFSGEIMPAKVLQYWKAMLPDTVFVNLYGPTEITCNCSYYIVDREFGLEESIPIGRPFRNTKILLLDMDTNSVIEEPMKQGEICVRGTCLSLGYYKDKERTKEAFVQSPEVSEYEEKLYKTGDLGYYDENGLLYFVSRKDYQIKHMGHRIELGEIEVAVNAIEYIDAAVCVFDERREKIVLFYQAGEKSKEFGSTKELERDIVLRLAKKLPKFMWPNCYVSYENLPVNKNGKIDRVFLKSTLQNE